MAEIRNEALKADIGVTRLRISDTLRLLERRAVAVASLRSDDVSRRAPRSSRTLAFEAGAALSAGYSAYRSAQAIRRRGVTRFALAAATLYAVQRLARL